MIARRVRRLLKNPQAPTAKGCADGSFPLSQRHLHAEDVPLADIAATVGTPFYCYSTATLTRHYHLFTEALSPLPHLVCFAIKSLSNVAVLKTLGDLGAGMDVVSGGEYLRAKAAGVPGERIVFSGVGKTREEMRLALTGGIRQFNVESEPELRALSEVATVARRDRARSPCG